jgi:bifunctional non-homologous end joining protein LigD
VPCACDLVEFGKRSGRIRIVTMPFAPMLATNSPPRTLRGRWVLEPKFDGWRVIVAVAEGVVRVWTRRGHELTQRLPELASLAEVIDSPVVLDGELVAGQGRASDFYGMLPRVAAMNRRVPLTFVAFDVLAYESPVIDEPYRERRAQLDRLGLHADNWCTAPQLYGSVVDVLSVCSEHDVEGIVAKRTDSRYRPGERSSDWLKLKTADWRKMHGPRRHEH